MSVARPYVLLVSLAAAMPASGAEVSANLGWNSEYLYRGIPQKTTSAFAGLDLSASGFYAGVWSADVGDGVEIDYYGGYSFDLGEVTLAVGGTLYTYTGDFDDTYRELNVQAEWRWATLDVATGQYDNFGLGDLDYTFVSLTVAHAGFYGKVGSFSRDFDGNYFEAGFGSSLTVGETDLLDYAIVAIHSDSTLLGGQSDTNLVLTLSKTFDL